MMDLQQYDFQGTRLPRWGCFWMSIGAGVSNFTDTDAGYPEVLNLYNKSLEEGCKVYLPDGTDRDGYVLEIDDKNVLNCTRPGVALRMWMKALGVKGEGHQTGDEGGFFPLTPSDTWGETFRLRRYVTKRGNGHWCMTTIGNRLLYNPDNRLTLKPRASKFYRRFYVDVH